MPNTSSPPRTIGLLGGSFNPAHEGHVHISRAARRVLELDEVWWLVSPQNPLKEKAGMAALGLRLKHARKLARPHRFIRVSDIEARLDTRYTVDTLEALIRRYPRCRFVWLMGADNLASFHRWRHWRRIAALCPILVLDRAPYSHAAQASKAALALRRYRMSERALKTLKTAPLPCWGYFHLPRHPASATALRRVHAETGFNPYG